MLPIPKIKQTKYLETDSFGGIDRIGREAFRVTEAENMTAEELPRLSVRSKRYVLKSASGQANYFNGIGDDGTFFWMQGNRFYYGGVLRGLCTAGESVKRRFVKLGSKIGIFPDKKFYDTESDTFGSLEATVSCSLATAEFRTGTLGGENAGVNTVYMPDMVWESYGLYLGDGVTVSYQTAANAPIQTVTATVRELTTGYMRFDSNVFEGLTDKVITGIGRYVPNMDLVFECGNRLFGAGGNKLFCSAPGDITNWNSDLCMTYDTGFSEDFTGGVYYNGIPTFFTENSVWRVYGDKPKNFEVKNSLSIVGVAEGSGASLAVASGKLFYLSGMGIMTYSGGIPELCSEQLGAHRYSDGVAISDGRNYYVKVSEDGTDVLLVYDSERKAWTTESAPPMNSAVCSGGNMYACGDKKVTAIGRVASTDENMTEETRINSLLEFGDICFSSQKIKQPLLLNLAVNCEEGATLVPYVSYDGGEFEEVDSIYSPSAGKCAISSADSQYTIALSGRSCIRMSLRLSGVGRYSLFGLGIKYREVKP